MKRTPEQLLAAKVLLDQRETAFVMGVPAGTIYYLHREKRLCGVKIGGKLRWRPADIRKYVDGLNGDLTDGE